jgi:hypothetical protein
MFFRFQHFGPFAPLTTCWNGPRPGETLLERSRRPTPSTARPARTNARGEVTLTPGAPRRRPAAWDPGDTRITALKAQVRFLCQIILAICYWKSKKDLNSGIFLDSKHLLWNVINVFEDVFQNNAQIFYILHLLLKMIVIPLYIHYFNFVYYNPHICIVFISKMKF